MTANYKHILLAGVALALPANAAAQETASEAQAENNQGIREIVVTARRTSENLQQVPLAVTALDPTALTERQVVEVADVGRVSPGL